MEQRLKGCLFWCLVPPHFDKGKLLGVPSMETEDGTPTSTGQAQFEATNELVKLWDIKNHIRGMVFDTTASNSGAKKGACTRLEASLDRPLFWLACRDHVSELIAKACWYELFDDDLGPDNSFFVDFEKQWKNIDTLRLIIP